MGVAFNTTKGIVNTKLWLENDPGDHTVCQSALPRNTEFLVKIIADPRDYLHLYGFHIPPPFVFLII